MAEYLQNHNFEVITNGFEFFAQRNFDITEKISPEKIEKIKQIIENITHILNSDIVKTDEKVIICKPCIINSSGEAIDKVDNSTQIIVTEINDQLLYQLSQNPSLLHKLSSYEFECVIARMFEKTGIFYRNNTKNLRWWERYLYCKTGIGFFLVLC